MAQRGSSSRTPRPFRGRTQGGAGDGDGSPPPLSVALLVALLSLPALPLAGCVTTNTRRGKLPQVTTKVFDEHGREVSGPGAATDVLGLGPRASDPLGQVSEDPQEQDQDLTPEQIQRRKEAAIRNQFGSTVLIRGDLVTKRYFMSGETGAMFLRLIAKDPAAAVPTAPAGPTKIGGAEDKSILGAMLVENQVELSYVPNFETVPNFKYGSPPGKEGSVPLVPLVVKAAPADTITNALLLVTAKAPDLLAFENALNLFYSNIPQVEIEVKVVEFSTNESLSWGTGGQKDGPPPATFNNLSASKLVGRITSQFPLIPPIGTGLSSIGSFNLGGIHDGWQLDATLQVLQAQGKADVLSAPKLVVRNGGEAAIATFTEFPFPQAQISGVNTAVNVSFRPVGVMMGIRPIIAGTETVILQIHADVSAVTGFAGTTPVETPIVSKRTAITQVHVPNGKTTIIGGLRTQQSFESEVKIPILGDIPILGYLFRSTTDQTSETELQFFITPRIRIGPADVLAR